MGDNGGVHAQNGFALQRNTAIFLLLDNYFDKFENKKFFVCLEHHDDFLFCFLNENEEVDLIEAYQSKKKGSDIWRLNEELYKIITKLLETGKDLIKDEIAKSSEYNHILYFSSNQTINLEHKPKKSEQLPTISVSINDDNLNENYSSLPNEIKEKITRNITEIDLHNELDNLSFIFIDLPKKPEEQENQLVGTINKVFGNKIFDKQAALSTIITLFHKIETTFNQGGKAKLLDKSKRISSETIQETFNIITAKSKAFDYWKKHTDSIAQKLEIPVSQKYSFRLDFESAFDFFKSIEQQEHRCILDFVKNNYQTLKAYTEADGVLELFQLFKKKNATHFIDIQLKAILFAALFEVLYLKEN
jgi:hypothetical protein